MGQHRPSRRNTNDDARTARRWDKLSDEERRAWSAEVAKQEALAQDIPLLASPREHRKIAAIMGVASGNGASREKPQRSVDDPAQPAKRAAFK